MNEEESKRREFQAGQEKGYEAGREDGLRRASEMADGNKVVNKTTLKVLPHEESCCNETLDTLIGDIEIEIDKKGS